MASAFDEFVRRQQAHQQQSGIDVAQELQEWRDALDKLYGQIAAYLKSYLEDGRATITSQEIELNEEFSGPYSAKQLTLSIGPAVVRFRPVGTMLIGAKGRVDVSGPHGSARLVLANRAVSGTRDLVRSTVSAGGKLVSSSGGLHPAEPIEWVWKLATAAPQTRLIELDQSVFFDMILSVADA